MQLKWLVYIYALTVHTDNLLIAFLSLQTDQPANGKAKKCNMWLKWPNARVSMHLVKSTHTQIDSVYTCVCVNECI